MNPPSFPATTAADTTSIHLVAEMLQPCLTKAGDQIAAQMILGLLKLEKDEPKQARVVWDQLAFDLLHRLDANVTVLVYSELCSPSLIGENAPLPLKEELIQRIAHEMDYYHHHE